MLGFVMRETGEEKAFFTNDGRHLHKGDCVYLLPADTTAPLYIARILKLFRDKERTCLMQVRWYYRRQDLQHEPCVKPIEREVYYTNYCDIQSVESIVRTCKVLSEPEYTNISRSTAVRLDEDTHFYRYSYSAETGLFINTACREEPLERSLKRQRIGNIVKSQSLEDLVNALIELEQILPKHKLPSFWCKERSSWLDKVNHSKCVKEVSNHLLDFENSLQLFPSIGKADSKSRSAWIKALTSNADSESVLRSISSLKSYVLQRSELSPGIKRKAEESEVSELIEDGLKMRPLRTSISEETIAELIHDGRFFLIDQKLLPPAAPTQLKTIRAVMVGEKRDAKISLKFPSDQSIRKYFRRRRKQVDATGNGDQSNQEKLQPKLDEEILISSKIAADVLVKEISLDEFLSQQKEITSRFSKSPPLMPKTNTAPNPQKHSVNSASEPDSNSRNPKSEISDKESPVNVEIRWGLRRKVKFNRKHRNNFDKEPKKETILATPESTVGSSGKRRGRRREEREVCREETSLILKIPKDMQGRWNTERYRAAQLKVLDIMHEKKAVPEKPILRPALREEARKHIGDTGLLDHLLKHMTDMVVSNGERFRRRHNSEGAMEYWLEPEALMNFRKQAGIEDPFWFPPPGWKIGDKLPLNGRGMTPAEAEELKSVKDELEELKSLFSKFVTSAPKKEVEEIEKKPFADGIALPICKVEEGQAVVADEKSLQLHVVQNDNQKKDNPTPTKKWSRSLIMEKLEKLEAYTKDLEGKYMSLSAEKESWEKQVLTMSTTIVKLQDEMSKMIQSSGAQSMEKTTVVTNGSGPAPDTPMICNSNSSIDKAVKATDENSNSQTGVKKARGQSGFRICKPEGTFMWPNMVAQIEDAYSPRMSSGSNGDDKAPGRQLPPTSACSSFQQTTMTMVAAPDCSRNSPNSNYSCQREYSYSNKGCDQQQQQQPCFKQQYTRMVPQNEMVSLHLRPVRWTQSNDLNHRAFAQQQQQQSQQQSLGGNDVVRPTPSPIVVSGNPSQQCVQAQYVPPRSSAPAACQSSWLALAPPPSTPRSNPRNLL